MVEKKKEEEKRRKDDGGSNGVVSNAGYSILWWALPALLLAITVAIFVGRGIHCYC